MICWCCAPTPTALGDEFHVEPAPGVDGQMPLVALDKRYFGMIDDFETRIADGPPSLREAERLVVNGDVTSARASSCAVMSSSPRRPRACASPTAPS